MLDPISRFVMDYLIEVIAQLIMPMMLVAFFGTVAVRLALYYIARCELSFATEFYKRVFHHLNNPDAPKVASFHRLIRILLVKTYVENFETKNRYKRRNLDYVQSLGERMFLIQDGIKRLIEDTMGQTRYLRKEAGAHEEQKIIEVSKRCFETNPYFNRLIGIFSVRLLNDILSIMPSLFIIGGIFGTFLGISKSLPDLGGMDLNNMDETKRVMDLFLIKISQSMIKSIMGIGFSVFTSLLNTMFSIEGTHYQVVNKYAAGLEGVWNETTTNELDRTEVFPKDDASLSKQPAKAAPPKAA